MTQDEQALAVGRAGVPRETCPAIGAIGIDPGLPEPLDGEALRKDYLAKLPKGEAEILGTLIAAFPDGLAREEAGGDAYKRSSRNTYLQRLAARGLVVAERNGTVRAHSDLFA